MTANDILRNYNLADASESFRFFLYGHHLLTDSDNKKILCATIKFIKDSNRFAN